jgi:hypothetical protein
VDESRKRVLAIMASILAARKLAQYESREAGSCHDVRDSGCGSLGRKRF